MLCLVAVAQTFAEEPAEQLAEATRTYDLAAAQSLVSALAVSDAADALELRIKGTLLVAELLRMEFSYVPERETKTRRALGEEIDAAADGGLADVDGLPESSEKYRIRADLLGTKIRSNYRAGKFKGAMNGAIEKALALDPQNARAHISKAKTLLFRPSPSENEIREALVLLESAHTLDASLEQARLLQAYGHEQLGETDVAVAIWKQCQEANPDCLPATRALQSHQSE